MTRSSRSAPAQEQAGWTAWGRSDAALLGLARVTVALIAVQFALAGLGAFTMDKTPTDNVYAAHVVLGLLIALLTLVILGVVLASRPARAHRVTFRVAVWLAVLAIPVQTVLGEAGKSVPAVGAVHALNGLIIFALAAWLIITTMRRKSASTPG